MASQTPEYSLKKSFEKVGTLPIPIFKDQKGTIIDGLNRERAGVKCPVVTIPVENPLQLNIIKLIVNGVRRTMTAAEKTAILDNIAELSGWNPKEMEEHLPFSYSWIMKYLSPQYKDRGKAVAGALGGAKSGASQRQAEAKEVLQPKESESEEEFALRFTQLFKSHLGQLIKKDIPVIITHMNEDHDCEKCSMTESCAYFLAFVKNVKEQLPVCMQQKL